MQLSPAEHTDTVLLAGPQQASAGLTLTKDTKAVLNERLNYLLTIDRRTITHC